jgi:hypothetical protein
LPTSERLALNAEREEGWLSEFSVFRTWYSSSFSVPLWKYLHAKRHVTLSEGLLRDTQFQVEVLRLYCEHLRTLIDRVIIKLTAY